MRDWFLRRESARSIRICKTALGVILFSHYFLLLFRVRELAGLFGSFQWLDLTICALATLAAAGFGIFWRKRWPGFALALTHYYFVSHYATLFEGAWAEIITLPILYLAVAKIDQGQVAAWPRRLIQLQVCSVYWVSAGEKINNSIWEEGHAYFYLLSGHLSRFPGISWRIPPLMDAVATHFTWLLEWTAPILLWVPAVRPFMILLLLLMHGATEVMTSAGWSNIIPMLFLICFFGIGSGRATSV